MKKIIATITTVLIMHVGFGQATSDYKTRLDSVSAIVIRYMQAKQADSIYALAGERFKSQLTAANFKSIAETQVFVLNDFKNVTYIGIDNNINKYKVAGTPVLQLLISLDKENKLETFLIQPFSDN